MKDSIFNKTNAIMMSMVMMFSIIGGGIGASVVWPLGPPVPGGTDINSAGRIIQTFFATGSTFETNPFDGTPFVGSTGGGILDRLQWLQERVGNVMIPIGTVVAFYGNTAPDGWIMCDGGSTASYPELASVVGPSVPDLRGRVIAGVNNGASLLPSWADTLGGTAGASTHTLSVSEMPSHNHGASSDIQGAHKHNYVFRNSVFGSSAAFANDVVHSFDDKNLETSSAGDHSHGITVDYNGGNGAHNNVQPTMALNYIIKAYNIQ